MYNILFKRLRVYNIALKKYNIYKKQLKATPINTINLPIAQLAERRTVNGIKLLSVCRVFESHWEDSFF